MQQFRETNDKNVGWYYEEPYINNKIKTFFKEYVGIRKDQLHTHLVTFVSHDCSSIVGQLAVSPVLKRNKAWNIRPFPCVGHWLFLKSTLDWGSIGHEESVIIDRLNEGATSLDLGCAMAQTMRYLAWQGAPTNNMVVSGMSHHVPVAAYDASAHVLTCALDLLPDFYEASFDLFHDREKIRANFVQCDTFDLRSSLLQNYQYPFDIVLAGDFLHQFSRAEAFTAACHMIQLSKPRAGSLIVDKQIERIYKDEENVETDGAMAR